MANTRSSTESTRHRRRTSSAQAHASAGPSPVSPTFPGHFPPSISAPEASPVKEGIRRNPTRVIRTFEEVERVVTAEEWYEELECGICAHVLGVPHSLVPCGHSFCGPCAWEWIRTNKNYTCPHCRMTVLEATPFIPNIVVDQIIERKLRSLPGQPLRDEMVAERTEKQLAWKQLMATLAPVKPLPRRPRTLELVHSLFDSAASDPDQVRARRRASRHLPELGAPIQHHRQQQPHPYAGMNLSDISRIEAQAPSRNEIRRLRENRLREASGGLLGSVLENEPESYLNDSPGAASRRTRHPAHGEASTPHSARPPASSAPSNAPPHLTIEVPPASPRAEPSPRSPPIIGRSTPLRSQAFVTRQARGRHGTRETPLVVLSDSDSD